MFSELTVAFASSGLLKAGGLSEANQNERLQLFQLLPGQANSVLKAIHRFAQLAVAY